MYQLTNTDILTFIPTLDASGDTLQESLLCHRFSDRRRTRRFHQLSNNREIFPRNEYTIYFSRVSNPTSDQCLDMLLLSFPLGLHRIPSNKRWVVFSRALLSKISSLEMKITETRKPVTEEQADQLRPIFESGFDTQPSESFLQRLNEKTGLSILLAHKGEALIGFKIGYTRYKGIFFSWLGAIDQAHKRTGVARKLVQHQNNLCVEIGYHEIQTEVLATNQPMLILNLQKGFEVSGVQLGRKDALTVQLRKRFSQPES